MGWSVELSLVVEPPGASVEVVYAVWMEGVMVIEEFRDAALAVAGPNVEASPPPSPELPLGADDPSRKRWTKYGPHRRARM